MKTPNVNACGGSSCRGFAVALAISAFGIGFGSCATPDGIPEGPVEFEVSQPARIVATQGQYWPHAARGGDPEIVLVVWGDVRRRGEFTALRGTRISGTGQSFDPEGILIAESSCQYPRVAGTRNAFVVAWTNPYGGIECAILNGKGEVQGEAPIPIEGSRGDTLFGPLVCAVGDRFLVVGRSDKQDFSRAVWVEPSGQVQLAVSPTNSGAPLFPAGFHAMGVGSSTNGFLVAGMYQSRPHLFAFDLSGRPLDDGGRTLLNSGFSSFTIASDGGSYLIGGMSFREREGTGLEYLRVSRDGIPTAKPLFYPASYHQMGEPEIIWDGSDYWSTWIQDAEIRRVLIPKADAFPAEVLSSPRLFDTTYYAGTVSTVSVASGVIVIWGSNVNPGIWSLFADATRPVNLSEARLLTYSPTWSAWPDAAISRNGFMVTWLDQRALFVPPAVFARRFDRQGRPLDAHPIEVASTPWHIVDGPAPRVASDGSDYMVTWVSGGDGVYSSEIHVQRIAGDGRGLLGPQISSHRSSSLEPSLPVLAGNSHGYLWVWSQGDHSFEPGIFAKLLSPDGSSLRDLMIKRFQYRVAPMALLPSDRGVENFVTATDGSRYFLAWREAENEFNRNDIWGANPSIHCVLVDTDGSTSAIVELDAGPQLRTWRSWDFNERGWMKNPNTVADSSRETLDAVWLAGDFWVTWPSRPARDVDLRRTRVARLRLVGEDLRLIDRFYIPDHIGGEATLAGDDGLAILSSIPPTSPITRPYRGWTFAPDGTLAVPTSFSATEPNAIYQHPVAFALDGRFFMIAMSTDSSGVGRVRGFSTPLTRPLLLLEPRVTAKGEFETTVVPEKAGRFLLEASNDLRSWTPVAQHHSESRVPFRVTLPDIDRSGSRAYRIKTLATNEW